MNGNWYRARSLASKTFPAPQTNRQDFRPSGEPSKPKNVSLRSTTLKLRKILRLGQIRGCLVCITSSGRFSAATLKTTSDVVPEQFGLLQTRKFQLS